MFKGVWSVERLFTFFLSNNFPSLDPMTRPFTQNLVIHRSFKSSAVFWFKSKCYFAHTLSLCIGQGLRARAWSAWRISTYAKKQTAWMAFSSILLKYSSKYVYKIFSYNLYETDLSWLVWVIWKSFLWTTMILNTSLKRLLQKLHGINLWTFLWKHAATHCSLWSGFPFPFQPEAVGTVLLSPRTNLAENREWPTSSGHTRRHVHSFRDF